MLTVRPATDSDLAEVLRVERESFGRSEEAELVEEMLRDPSAQPVTSLLAELDGTAVGHVMFTRAAVQGAEGLGATLLAPLAVGARRGDADDRWMAGRR